MDAEMYSMSQKRKSQDFSRLGPLSKRDCVWLEIKSAHGMDRARVQETLDRLQLDIGRVQQLLRQDGHQQGVDEEGDDHAGMHEQHQGVRRRTSPRLDSVNRQHTTLAVISLDSPRNFEKPNKSLDTVLEEQMLRKSNSADSKLSNMGQLNANNGSNNASSARSAPLTNSNSLLIDDNEEESNEKGADTVCFWPFTLLQHRPTLRLALVMFLNGCLSMLCAALIIEIESPAQIERREEKARLQEKIDAVVATMNTLINTIGTEQYNGSRALELLDKYDALVPDLKNYPDEITWDMLSAQAFITSVQTTTGYGDIVPVTFKGKVFTLLYALVGIPVFMWYIVKLGSVFRMVIMKLIYGSLLCFGSMISTDPRMREERLRLSNSGGPVLRRWSTETRMRLRELNEHLNEQYLDDTRFHPSTMGMILFIFLCAVSFFISYMEGIDYFDSFYAAFITYSTIGFGDIDIFKISYRSSWFNFFIYGNFIHIVGYMIVSAWIASILEKFGVRKY